MESKILELRAQGRSLREIGNMVGISHTQVDKIIKASSEKIEDSINQYTETLDQISDLQLSIMVTEIFSEVIRQNEPFYDDVKDLERRLNIVKEILAHRLPKHPVLSAIRAVQMAYLGYLNSGHRDTLMYITFDKNLMYNLKQYAVFGLHEQQDLTDYNNKITWESVNT